MAVKNLSLAEEYLGDHFPGFPVMPGVLMLEALTQAGAWLVRDLEDFASMHHHFEASQDDQVWQFRGTGPTARAESRADRLRRPDCIFKGVGLIEGQEMVKGRFTLTRYNLRDRIPSCMRPTPSIVSGLRDLYTTLRKGSVGAGQSPAGPKRIAQPGLSP